MQLRGREPAQLSCNAHTRVPIKSVHIGQEERVQTFRSPGRSECRGTSRNSITLEGSYLYFVEPLQPLHSLIFSLFFAQEHGYTLKSCQISVEKVYQLAMYQETSP